MSRSCVSEIFLSAAPCHLFRCHANRNTNNEKLSVSTQLVLIVENGCGGVQRGYRWTQALRGWAWRWWRGRWWSSEGRCGRGGRPLVESGGGSGTLGTMASLHLETFLLVLGGSSGPARRILLLLRCLASALWPINCFSTLFSLSLFW